MKYAKGRYQIPCLSCILSTVLLLMVNTAVAQTGSVMLAWNPSTDPALVGYRIYDGVASRVYTNLVQVGNVTNATISGLIAGTAYFFSVTAYDRYGLESPYSNEIRYTATNSSSSGGSGCTYAISPASASFSSTGGTGSLSVTATAGCMWIATSSASWITINSASSGTGNGLVTYTVAMNTAAYSRTGTLTLAGRTFTINQAAAAADTTLPTVRLTAPAPGSSLSGVVSLAASASDNVGVTKVEFYCDGSSLQGTSLSSPYAVSCDTTKLGNGSHAFSAKAYDAAGNWATSTSVKVNVRNHK